MTLAIPDVAIEANTGPANSVTDQETGSRVYIHPLTGERFVSVTTVLSMVAKEALPYWAAKVVQEKALDSVPLLVKALRHRPCEQKGDDRCGACRDCVALELRREPDRQRDEAADRGTRVHKIAEHYALRGEIRPHDVDIEGHVKNWLRWQRDFEVSFDAAEVTVINRTYGYAGTLDGIVRCGWMPPKWRTGKNGCEDLRNVPLLEDLKTGKSVYDEHAWQLSAYRHGEAVLLPDGTEMPLPEAHPSIGLVVHVRADDYWVRPAMVSDRSFGTFLKVLGLYRDVEEFGPQLVGRAMYKPREQSADAAEPCDTPATEKEGQ